MKKYVYNNGIVSVEKVADYQLNEDEIKEQKLADIEQLKAQLASTDYKVVKLAECLAIGSEMPYNAQELHQQRQAIRDRINQLEMEVQNG